MKLAKTTNRSLAGTMVKVCCRFSGVVKTFKDSIFSSSVDSTVAASINFGCFKLIGRRKTST